MTTPKRIQRLRTKGSHLPPGCVCVTRPGKFGNPFTPEMCRADGYEGADEEIRHRCVNAFEAWLGKYWLEDYGPKLEAARTRLLAALPELRGKDLACWCPVGQACHGDVLLRLANKEGST